MQQLSYRLHLRQRHVLHRRSHLSRAVSLSLSVHMFVPLPTSLHFTFFIDALILACPTGQVLVNGQCLSSVPIGSPCTADAQCQGGAFCTSGVCTCPNGFTNVNNICSSPPTCEFPPYSFKNFLSIQSCRWFFLRCNCSLPVLHPFKNRDPSLCICLFAELCLLVNIARQAQIVNRLVLACRKLRATHSCCRLPVTGNQQLATGNRQRQSATSC